MKVYVGTYTCYQCTMSTYQFGGKVANAKLHVPSCKTWNKHANKESIDFTSSMPMENKCTCCTHSTAINGHI